MRSLRWEGIAAAVAAFVCLVAGVVEGNATYILVGLGVILVVGAVLAWQSRSE